MFRAVDFLVGEGVFRGGDGLPRGRAFLGVWKFSRYVGLLVMTAARCVSRTPQQWLSGLTAAALWPLSLSHEAVKTDSIGNSRNVVPAPELLLQ